jgi:plastocyanin
LNGSYITTLLCRLFLAALTTSVILIPYAGHSGGIVTVYIFRGTAHMPYAMNFHPSFVRVFIGVNETVRWVNLDDHYHTVTAINGKFDSEGLKMYMHYVYRFSTPGIYRYVCMPHPWMQGVVEVLNRV